MPGPAAPPNKQNARRRVLVSSTIGSTIEWYDFYLYSTAAALALGPLFMPTSSPESSTLAAFGTYAAGFVAHPLGGLIAGHFGDRIGRKSLLVATAVLMSPPAEGQSSMDSVGRRPAASIRPVIGQPKPILSSTSD